MSFFEDSAHPSSSIKKVLVKDSISLTITDDDFFNISAITYHIVIDSDSHLNLCIAIVNAQSIQLDIQIDIQGDNSSCDIVFLYTVSSDQNIKINTKQTHSGKQTVSKFYARGIVKNTAVVNHQGLILINENGYKSEAILEHKVIVFGTTAQVLLVPSIEVLNNDVQCSHGAAVGQFDQQQLWYLKSRGLDEKQAYQLLIRSFFKEFVGYFDQPERVLENLCQKML